AAVYAREVEARLGDAISLGAEIPREARPDREDQLTPIRPALDLAAGGDLLRRRPDALPAGAPASQAYAEIGARLMPIILETQKVTLAGFRILDPRGVVIAGRDEVGNRWRTSRRRPPRCKDNIARCCGFAFPTSR